ncbi:fumarylacetoacetate hydrolase family protein [Achromobacter marplatensis]|uniref:fumarylacetoacetate hydrolase family protein n=1 Tax=Achromobacter marplatensis TaxID=470868 RepID=UPI0039F64E00
MDILSFLQNGRSGLALRGKAGWLDLSRADSDLPDDVAALVALPDWQSRVEGAAAAAPLLEEPYEWLSPVRRPQKILCVGLNYLDHVAESPYKQPDYPTFFPRFASTLIGHEAALIKPRSSDDFDYEGELAVVIGRKARHVTVDDALEYVAGYTVFNEASVRDYQFKSPQWTMGKNFDGTGACGPWFTTADALPAGARGLMLTTRINGTVKQQASTSDMLFDVATLISLASEVLTLAPGDLLVTGTPAGVGFGMKPPVYLKPGDVCEVEIERIGILRNVVKQEF